MRSGRRRVAASIALAALAAVAVLVVLGSGGGSSGPDAYTVAVTRLCAKAEGEIARIRARHRRASAAGNLGPLLQSMFYAVGHLRTRLAALEAPADKLASAVELNDAMLAYESQLIRLARAPRSQLGRAAAVVDNDAATAKRAAAVLGVPECARLPLGVVSKNQLD